MLRMVNVIVNGNRLGKLESKKHTEGYSVWRICPSGKIRVKANISFIELKKLKLKNLITESEFESINIYSEFKKIVGL